ncbi:MAG: HAD family hydrolase [Christensenellales bacterium]|jgi:HAD superfamily hydrolase (TIGR01484 family)
MIKMIALDLDGTLVEHRPEGMYVPPRTLELFEELIGKGMYIGIDTGRAHWEMINILKDLRIGADSLFPSFFIAEENHIFWKKDGEFVPQSDHNEPMRKMLDEFAMSIAEETRSILEFLREHSAGPEFWVIFSTFALEMTYADVESAQKALDLLPKYFKDRDFKLHRNVVQVQVLPKDTGKGRTLLAAARHVGVQPCEVLTMGDSLNDWDMLANLYGFEAATVSNADPRVLDLIKSRNGYIAKGVAGEGVRETIEYYRAHGRLAIK